MATASRSAHETRAGLTPTWAGLPTPLCRSSAYGSPQCTDWRSASDLAKCPLEYLLNVDDLDGSHSPPGNLHAVAAELREMTKANKELYEIIRNASVEPA